MTLATFSELNYIAVAVAAILYFALGALWYGALFGKPWMAEIGLTEEAMQNDNNPVLYLFTLLLYLIAGVIVAYLIHVLGLTTIAEGIFLAGLGYMGFLLPSLGATFIFESRTTRLFLIDSGYHFFGFIILGVVLTLWP